MFWTAKPTIEADDEEWQLLAWRWLLDNLGGIDALRSFPTRFPSHRDFPKSGKSGHAHVEFVFEQVTAAMGIDPEPFSLVAQDETVDRMLGPLAVVQNAPNDPAGTYQATDNSHLISYNPETARDLESLIATLVHEVCHAVLFSIPVAPPGDDSAEEFATDLATVFFGFGVFGGNGSFRFKQYHDAATGTQGWSTQRMGYLSQNEWGYALALRACLTGEGTGIVEQYGSSGLVSNFRKNVRYFKKNRNKLAEAFDDVLAMQ